jgi:hypothetical protein
MNFKIKKLKLYRIHSIKNLNKKVGDEKFLLIHFLVVSCCFYLVPEIVQLNRTRS